MRLVGASAPPRLPPALHLTPAFTSLSLNWLMAASNSAPGISSACVQMTMPRQLPEGTHINPHNKTAQQLAIAAGLLLLPLLLQNFGTHWVRTADTCLLYLMLALGMNIVVGYAGLLDLGYVAFYAVGAYLFALLASPHLTEHFVWVAALFPAGLSKSQSGRHATPRSTWSGGFVQRRLDVHALDFGFERRR